MHSSKKKVRGEGCFSSEEFRGPFLDAWKENRRVKVYGDRRLEKNEKNNLPFEFSISNQRQAFFLKLSNNSLVDPRGTTSGYQMSWTFNWFRLFDYCYRTSIMKFDIFSCLSKCGKF